MDSKIINNNTIKATYGSTKFCTYYLKGKECTNKECLYLHTDANDQDDILERDDINNKINFRAQQIQAIKIANIFNFEVRKKLITSERLANSVLPGVHTIYDNPIVYDHDLNHLEFEKFMRKEKETPSKTSDKSNDESNTKSKSKDKDRLKDEKIEDGYSSQSNKSMKDEEEYVEMKTSENQRDDDKRESDSVNNSDSDYDKNRLVSTTDKSLKQIEGINDNALKLSISTSNDSMNIERENSSRLFKSKSFSRFTFAEEDNKSTENGIDIPRFVTQIINNNMTKTHNAFCKLLEDQVIHNISNEHKDDKEHIDYEWASFLIQTRNKNTENSEKKEL